MTVSQLMKELGKKFETYVAIECEFRIFSTDQPTKKWKLYVAGKGFNDQTKYHEYFNSFEDLHSFATGILNETAETVIQAENLLK